MKPDFHSDCPSSVNQTGWFGIKSSCVDLCLSVQHVSLLVVFSGGQSVVMVDTSGPSVC